MFLSNLSIKRPIFATVMMLALVTLGIFSYRRLAVDIFPDVEIPVVSVVTKFPGSSPETVEKEVSKRIPPGKEVTFSFHWKVDEGGEYPVRVLFIHPSGKGIVKPYRGTLTVLSSEPIDELDKETLNLLEKKGKKKASVYKSLGKSLEEFFYPPPAQFGKLAKKTSKTILATLKSILEKRQNLSFSDKSLEDRDLLEVGKNLKEVM